MTATRINHRVNASRQKVYRALLDAGAVATWMVPTGMTSHVHAFDPREGGGLRISLRYDAPTGSISLAHADGGTDVLAVHDRLPPGLSPADNEAGWRSSLAKLAALVEAGS
jgi:hypothetical protein